MAIDRYALVTRHNPVLTEANVYSPLSVGNGNFAFTADITGMQTLYEEYQRTLPLCTMAQWAWHTEPVSRERYSYSLEDVEMTEYPYQGRTVSYAVEKKKGNEAVYDWVRENPHKLNLARIGLVKNGRPLSKEQIGSIHQELKLYEGILESRYTIDGKECRVRTGADSKTDAVTFQIESEAFAEGLEIEAAFPYGSPEIGASDWDREADHETEILEQDDARAVLKRTLDRDVYYVTVSLEKCRFRQVGKHAFRISPADSREIAVTFCFEKQAPGEPSKSGAVLENSRNYWKTFWTKGGAVDLHRSKDERAWELERRIVLSQYLMAIQSAGDIPPQETGLTCNSWYGKFHLEMYLWHEAYLPLWNHTDLLERSLKWYQKRLPEARKNAARNGFKGARWPKMVAEDGVDSPSPIATLLIWQQPHIIYMLELAYQNRKEKKFLEDYYELVEETAEFMADFAVYNAERGVYELLGPAIPVQERYAPMTVKNPAFEVEYWCFTLRIALKWAERLGKPAPERWRDVAEHMAEIAVGEGRYLAHDNCPDTYENFAEDHPSMLCAYGLIDSGRIDREIMRRSLEKAEECWDYPSLWGWDFAVMGMTAVRLGDPDYAIDLLLMDSPKNIYVESGNNFQKTRDDLPLYLPGNGSLLLALPLMTAGYPGSGSLPGFPKDGNWEVEFENIDPFPY